MRVNQYIKILLINDVEGNERVVYYLSRVLNDVETRYSSVEKLCLSLYRACTKLKSYMIARDVHVISKTDVIKYMLSYSILSRHIGKWMLALIEFSLQYVPAKAVKGQVLADFLVDDPCLDVESLEVKYVELKPWKLYFYGSRH